MSRAGKTAEPSMEEILSSIRKIIAEEPVGSRGAPMQAAPGASASGKAAVDDVLGLADAPRPEAAAGTANVPSWLFPTARAEAATDAAGTPASSVPDAAAEVPREAPRPFFPGGAAAPGAPAASAAHRAGMNGAHPPAEDARAETGAAPSASAGERRTPQTGIPNWLNRGGAKANGAAAPAAPAAPQPVAAPTEPTRIAAREPEAPALSELSISAPAKPAEPVAASPVTPAVAADAATSAAAVAPVAEPAGAAAAASSDASAGAVAVKETPSHSAVPKPTLIGERSRAPKAADAGDLVPAPQAGGVRTLEDTVVDLLRPLIRQWLDENMPRMVEKAIRLEVAASVKAKLDQK